MLPELDPEIAAAIAARQVPPEALVEIPLGNVVSRREFHERALAQTNTSVVAGISTHDFQVQSGDGSSILCRWYNPTGSDAQEGPTAAVIYFHGGGYILGNVPLFDRVCSSYALNTNVPFLSVGYRLAPEHPFPKAVEDAFAALCWVHAEALSLKIDTNRIAVMGDSAGGGLAASLAHFCTHKKGPSIAKQILIYPMLDDRSSKSGFDSDVRPFLTWTPSDNITAWDALLGLAAERAADLLPWAVPARMSDEHAAGLPAVYMEIAELDLFRDEDLDYVARLAKVGVKTESHMRHGCLHGWEHIAPKAKITSLAMGDRWRCIREL